MTSLLEEIQFNGLRSEIKSSVIVSDIEKGANKAISLVTKTGQSEEGLKIVQFLKRVCWDELNIGEYHQIHPHWRMVGYF